MCTNLFWRIIVQVKRFFSQILKDVRKLGKLVKKEIIMKEKYQNASICVYCVFVKEYTTWYTCKKKTVLFILQITVYDAVKYFKH